MLWRFLDAVSYRAKHARRKHCGAMKGLQGIKDPSVHHSVNLVVVVGNVVDDRVEVAFHRVGFLFSRTD